MPSYPGRCGRVRQLHTRTYIGYRIAHHPDTYRQHVKSAGIRGQPPRLAANVATPLMKPKELLENANLAKSSMRPCNWVEKVPVNVEGRKIPQVVPTWTKERYTLRPLRMCPTSQTILSVRIFAEDRIRWTGVLRLHPSRRTSSVISTSMGEALRREFGEKK